MQVGQVAGVGLVAIALLLSDGNDRARVLTALRSHRDLPLSLLLQQHFDRVVRVDAPQLCIITQHFRGDLSRYAIFCGNTALRGRDRAVPLGSLLGLFPLGLGYTRSETGL